MRILVKYNNSFYYWVDTVTMHDERDYTCAILVSSEGVAFPISLDKIEVVDDSYKYEKEKARLEKRIDELKFEASTLKLQTELNAKIQEAYNKEYLIRKELIKGVQNER